VAYFPAAKVLSSKTGGFTEYLSVNGSWEQIRSSDGVHLLPPGYDLLAQALVQPMQLAWHVDLHVG
jgi:lysophospholipase L1-like esterase